MTACKDPLEATVPKDRDADRAVGRNVHYVVWCELEAVVDMQDSFSHRRCCFWRHVNIWLSLRSRGYSRSGARFHFKEIHTSLTQIGESAQ